jgi:hypothetical protein
MGQLAAVSTAGKKELLLMCEYSVLELGALFCSVCLKMS